MEMNPENSHSEIKPRPRLLSVLCILSFISLGLSFVSVVGSLFYGPTSSTEIVQQRADLAVSTEKMRSTGMGEVADAFEQVQRMNEALNRHFYEASAVSILLVVLGFYGVLSMWKGRKIGFHIYIIYNLATISNLYLFVSPTDIPSYAVIWGVLISAIFIMLYARNLKWLS
jgi:hypothetical protein